jgi:uncharacterized membrane protein
MVAVKGFFSAFDSDRIVAAIGAAERLTSGEIRVHVTKRSPKDLAARAERRFQLLGMTRTAERNGVLIYIAPKARTFRILGDAGIHEKAGEEFWTQVAAVIEEHFRRGEFTDGVVRGVERVGELLATHFPRKTDDRNELPDQVTED